MTKKTRLIMLLVCVAAFLLVVPYIVLYSLGYRVDFAKQEIVATGGIYVKAEPTGTEISIDGGAKTTTGFFANSVFVQNLAPGQHAVSIKKDGYVDYQKSLVVKEKEVTKLEEVVLFKKDIAFEQLTSTILFKQLTKKPVEQFVIKNSNLYYANTPENASLTATQKATPIIKNILAFEASSNSILWLRTDGVLNTFTMATKVSEPVTNTPHPISKKQPYVLKTLAGNIFLTEGATAFIFNKITAVFEPFYVTVKDFKVSPDNQKIAYYNDHELWYWLIDGKTKPEKILLQKTQNTITSVYWINNNYMLFVAGDTIIITEIDVRGNVNIAKLTQPATSLKDAETFFHPEEKKLYILNQNSLLVSDRLLP